MMMMMVSQMMTKSQILMMNMIRMMMRMMTMTREHLDFLVLQAEALGEEGQGLKMRLVMSKLIID